MAKRPECSTCQRALSVCLCPHIRQIENHWPIHILQHSSETRHAIGTAKIAQLSLQHCQTTVCNQIDPGSDFEQWLEETNPILIYPGDEAQELESLVNTSTNKQANTPTRTLLLIDANWRKSRRMFHESPQLQPLQRVSIQPNSQSRYKIRKVPNPESLSTLEAIVEILSVLEQDHYKYQPLLDAMDWMINQQIQKMGSALFEKNYPKQRPS